MRRPVGEGQGGRLFLIVIALGFLALMLLLPLVTVFAQALGQGIGGFATAITEPDALAAMRLTL
ncbi:MAG: sulfate ABC transporter permease subunit CysW, partial [Sphingomicrobium sp.]